MTTSQEPWTVNGSTIKDQHGNDIGFFKDGRDADRVVDALRQQTEMKAKIQTLLDQMQNTIE